MRERTSERAKREIKLGCAGGGKGEKMLAPKITLTPILVVYRSLSFRLCLALFLKTGSIVQYCARTFELNWAIG